MYQNGGPEAHLQYFPELNGPQMQHLRAHSWDICKHIKVCLHPHKQNKCALLVAPDLRAPWLL